LEEEEENRMKARDPTAAAWTRADAETLLEHLEKLNNAKAEGAAANDKDEGMQVDVDDKEDEEAQQEQEEDDDHASQAKKAAEEHFRIAQEYSLTTLGNGSVHRLAQVENDQDSRLLSWAAQQYLSLVVAKDKSQVEGFRKVHPEVGIWVLPWVKMHTPRDDNVKGAQRLADLCVVSEDDVAGDDDKGCTRLLLDSIFGDDLVFDKEADMIAYRSSLPDQADVPTLYARDKDSRLLHNGRLESCASERIPLRFRTLTPSAARRQPHAVSLTQGKPRQNSSSS
jgi:hypothetical protein